MKRSNMIKKYQQKGYNDRYPLEIETWVWGDSGIPDWLTDNCNIKELTDFGDIIPERNLTNEGGYIITKAGSASTLVKTKSEEDFICFGKKLNNSTVIFSLTPIQLSLLYEEVV
jgi:hypothetical protein